jgi:hypothetical protein
MRTKHALFAVVVLLAFGLRAPAQAGPLEEKLQKKLAKPFVKNAAWELDYDAARKRASESGKLILAYFTRSYAP